MKIVERLKEGCDGLKKKVMVDPPLLQVYQNFQKGVDRANLVMIILPPLAQFDACLTSHALPRTRTAKCTQYVTTLSDFETLLLQMTTGFMPKLLFVLPIDEATQMRHTEIPFPTWVSSERILGSEKCKWVRDADDVSEIRVDLR